MSAAIMLAGSSAIALSVVPFLDSQRKSVRVTAWILGVAAFVAISALCVWHAFGDAGALGSLLGAATERWRALTEFEKGVFSTLAAVLPAGSALVGLAVVLRSRQMAPIAPERPNALVTPVAVERSDTPQATTLIASPEIPDSEAVPALLDRLPGNQNSLLISLELGEKVLALDEPGLSDLERNRLAQRIRLVHGNRYLFRMHPDNSAAIRSWVVRMTTGRPAVAPVEVAVPKPSSDTARESALALALVDSYCDKAYNNLETMQRLRGLHKVCAAAEGWAREYLLHEIIMYERSLHDPAREIIRGLVERCLRPVLEKGQADLDARMAAAGDLVSRRQLDNLNESFRVMLGCYKHACEWIYGIGVFYFGEAVLVDSTGYRELSHRHQELLRILRDIQHRSDIGTIIPGGIREVEGWVPPPTKKS